jgi:hypothetical protein
MGDEFFYYFDQGGKMVMVGAMRILGTSMPMLSAIDQQPLHLQS